MKSRIIHAAPPRPLNVTMTVALATASETSVSIDGLLHWDIYEDSNTMDVLNTSYIIIVTPESENQTITETSNVFTNVTLFYEQDYSISVVATNCIGITSEPAELYVIWPWDG